MNTNYAINVISKKNKGQFFKMTYITDVTLSAKGKREGHVVLKYTHGTFRWGINYNNMKSVQLKRKEGALPADPQKLPWGEWSASHPGLVIEHKGTEYLRVYASPNKNKATYYLDGRPISIEDLKETGFVVPSYWKKSSPDCLTIKIANIQEIF